MRLAGLDPERGDGFDIATGFNVYGATFAMSKLMTLLLGSISLAGCATLKNTPAQDATIRHFDECVSEVHPVRAYLTGVSPDGSYRWNSAADDQKGRNDMTDCMYRKGHKRL